jgi:hypothetical protein
VIHTYILNQVDTRYFTPRSFFDPLHYCLSICLTVRLLHAKKATRRLRSTARGESSPRREVTGKTSENVVEALRPEH